MLLMDSLVEWTQLTPPKKKISALQDINRNLQNEKAKRDWKTKPNRIPKTCRTTKKCNICKMGIPEGDKREEGTEEISEAIMTKNFSMLIVRQQTRNPGRSQNTKQDNSPHPTPPPKKYFTQGISYSNRKNSKTKIMILKEPE